MKGNWQPFLIQKYLGLIWRNSKAKALERVGTLLSTKGGNICAAVLEGAMVTAVVASHSGLCSKTMFMFIQTMLKNQDLEDFWTCIVDNFWIGVHNPWCC